MKLGSSLLVASATALNTFGPNHCVSVTRNDSTGTCVLKTNCDGFNLDDVEFAFTCQLPKMLQKHSFGKGGFDAVEEFDTSVKCDACGLPAEVAMTLKSAKSIKKLKKIQKEEPAAVEEPAAEAAAPAVQDSAPVKFGPDNCISTWLKGDETPEDGEQGVCYVKTQCAASGVAFESYPIGLVCMDKDSVPTRHLFGSNSFDREEEFNTLIRCTSCLGLDEVSESVTLEATVKSISKTLSDLDAKVTKVEASVESLKAPEKAEEKTEEPAPAAEGEAEGEEAAEESEAGQQALLLHQAKRSHKHKHHLRANRRFHNNARRMAEEFEDTSEAPIVEDVYDDDE